MALKKKSGTLSMEALAQQANDDAARAERAARRLPGDGCLAGPNGERVVPGSARDLELLSRDRIEPWPHGGPHEAMHPTR